MKEAAPTQGRAMPAPPPQRTTTADFREFKQSFQSLGPWKAWLETNRWSMDPSYADELVEHLRHYGFYDPVLGFAAPGQIAVGKPYHESLLFRGVNSRQRALLRAIVDADLARKSRVYASEAVTPLADALRLMFPEFVGSEYLPTQAERARFPLLRHEDIEALSFKDASLDAYVSSGVLEHVPSVSKAIHEAARVLADGGAFFAYFPFRVVHQETLVKAVRDAAGQTVLLTEPEYHGDPTMPDGKGVLVYSIPGWDILDLARDAGFRNAEMIGITSRLNGIVCSEAPAPVMIMFAVK